MAKTVTHRCAGWPFMMRIILQSKLQSKKKPRKLRCKVQGGGSARLMSHDIPQIESMVLKANSNPLYTFYTIKKPDA